MLVKNENEYVYVPATVDDILELEDIEYALTRWEQDFVESMQDWQGNPTYRQQEILDEIYEKYKEMNDVAELKLPPVSYTFHRNWQNCPRQAWHVNIARDVQGEPTEAMRWGTRVHEALEQHLREGEDLPPELSHHQHLYQFPVGYDVDAELKLGMDIHGRYCDFFDPDCWFRGVLDVVLTRPEVPSWAIIIDHKTGKLREDPYELELHAVLLHAYNPNLTNIKGWYNWLRDNRMGRVYDLSDTEQTLKDLRWTRTRIKAAFDLGERAFPPRQSGLCPWCPVLTCEFHP